MRCSSCNTTMRSTRSTVVDGRSQQELRCPKCGNQTIRSQLVVEDEPFDVDPFVNFCRLSDKTRSDTHGDGSIEQVSPRIP